jgi:hypothetical protein
MNACRNAAKPWAPRPGARRELLQLLRHAEMLLIARCIAKYRSPDTFPCFGAGVYTVHTHSSLPSARGITARNWLLADGIMLRRLARSSTRSLELFP